MGIPWSPIKRGTWSPTCSRWRITAERLVYETDSIGGRAMNWIRLVVLSSLLSGIGYPRSADEAPIAGTLKGVDPTAQTVTVEATAKGKTRQVVILVKPSSKIVRFVRPTEPGKTGFIEQPI